MKNKNTIFTRIVIIALIIALYISTSFAANPKEIPKQNILDAQVAVQNIKDEYLKKAQANGFIKKAPETIIFVSFSMPTPSLKQIIQDAARYQIPVVIRGLYKNSFKETIEKIFDLVKEDNKGGVLINPLWFKQYDIKTVPALVISGGGVNTNKDHQEFDVVYGNIPIKKLLKIIVERGSEAKAAQNILNRGNS